VLSLGSLGRKSKKQARGGCLVGCAPFKTTWLEWRVAGQNHLSRAHLFYQNAGTLSSFVLTSVACACGHVCTAHVVAFGFCARLSFCSRGIVVCGQALSAMLNTSCRLSNASWWVTEP
jgi:hypothetical protein